MNLLIYWRCLAALVLLLSLVLAEKFSEAGHHTNTSNYVRQEDIDTNPLNEFYDKLAKASLMIQDQQTFCQATILSNTAAVLAASCFDYDENMKVDVAQYNLAIEGDDAAGVLRTQISNITPHPNYDSVSFANNIAVITFTEITTTVSYMINNAPSSGVSFVHVHFSLNVYNSMYFAPQLDNLPLGDQNECGASSLLFQAYQSDFICSMSKVPSMMTAGCSLPYQFVFEPGNGILGFYSHSSLGGNGTFCGDNQIYNYYLIIAHYIPWINLLIDPDVTVGNGQNITPETVAESYSMAKPTSGSTNGRFICSLYKFENVIPVVENLPSESPNLSETVTSSEILTSVTIVTESKIETLSETITQTVNETTASISITTAEPITVTVTDTIINTEQISNIVSTTQDLTTNADHTTTVSETITTTDTTTATETVTATLLQMLTGTLTTIQSDTLTQSQTLTSLITTTAVSASECPVVTCDTSVEVSILTVTETKMDTSVEKQTVTLTELGRMTVDNHEFSAVVVTATISQPPETITQTVASDQSVDPLTVTSIIVETLVISQTETLEGNVDSIFATITAEVELSSTSAEPEPETKSNTLQPWMIALIAGIAVTVVLIMALVGYYYFMWKRRQHELYLASLVTPAEYPQEYLNPQFKEKGNDRYDIPGSYNLPKERQSQYNSKGSYVGYT